jgi:hypothetical protein
MADLVCTITNRANLYQVSTVWTAPVEHGSSHAFAEWEILALRGRSILQVGLTILDEARRSTFWGEIPPGKTIYLFSDRYGFGTIKDGAKELIRLPQGAVDFPARSRVQVRLDTAESRITFMWNGKFISSAKLDTAFSSRESLSVFALQMLGSGDEVALVASSGLCRATEALQATRWGGLCVDGHTCSMSPFSLDGYHNGWICSLCEGRGEGPRYRTHQPLNAIR